LLHMLGVIDVFMILIYAPYRRKSMSSKLQLCKIITIITVDYYSIKKSEGFTIFLNRIVSNADMEIRNVDESTEVACGPSIVPVHICWGQQNMSHDAPSLPGRCSR
jgi:hypothetical protein